MKLNYLKRTPVDKHKLWEAKNAIITQLIDIKLFSYSIYQLRNFQNKVFYNKRNKSLVL